MGFGGRLQLKDMTCRVALLRMHDQGLITLPASRIPAARRRPDFPATPASDPQCALLLPVHEIGPLTLRLVAGAPVSRLWNEYVQRYHYLGYTAMSRTTTRADARAVPARAGRSGPCGPCLAPRASFWGQVSIRLD